jgi:signal transduction histidine kinase
LVAGVHALEEGNFAYPLKVTGNDEVSELTAAFQRMRVALHEAQGRLLDAERLATIGSMASMISHDLRHSLTAILAYAKFLSEGKLSEVQRNDFYQEIRWAVNRMTDEISSLLGFSKQRQAIRPAYHSFKEVIERAINTVKVLPEFESIAITFSHEGPDTGWFDAGKVERVMLNLFFNACEAVSPDSGRIEVRSRISDAGHRNSCDG